MMNKRSLTSGLTFLVLTGCVTNQEFDPTADLPYTESRNGYFTENGKNYLGKDGKRYQIWIDEIGVKQTTIMKFNGESYYCFSFGRGQLDIEINWFTKLFHYL